MGTPEEQNVLEIKFGTTNTTWALSYRALGGVCALPASQPGVYSTSQSSTSLRAEVFHE